MMVSELQPPPKVTTTADVIARDERLYGGKRATNGMANFADTLSKDDAEAIHQYVIARANADWEGAGASN